MSAEPRFIVAEISHTWVDGGTDALISEQFESVLETNRQRGYVLRSFALSQVVRKGGMNERKGQPFPDELIETIVAVFEKETTDARQT